MIFCASGVLRLMMNSNFGGLFDRKIRWLDISENLVDVMTGTAVDVSRGSNAALLQAVRSEISSGRRLGFSDAQA